MPRRRAAALLTRTFSLVSTEPSLDEEHPGPQSPRPRVGARPSSPLATFVDSRATRLVYAAPAVVGSSEMAITIETPRGTDALTEFVLFQDAVYAGRSARWPALPPLQLPMLAGESPFAEGRTLHPLLARDGGRILARALALLDGRYNRHWNERLA